MNAYAMLAAVLLAGGFALNVQAADTPYAKFESLDDSQLAQSVKGLVPQAKTLADQLAFLGLHESHHAGQMAYIRKALGYSALVG